MTALKLTPEEQAMLDGEHGPAARKAMEILATLGEIYDAESLLPVASVQIAGVSYDNLGEAGLHFLDEMASRRRAGARADHAQPGRHGHRELGGAGHQPRVRQRTRSASSRPLNA